MYPLELELLYIALISLTVAKYIGTIPAWVISPLLGLCAHPLQNVELAVFLKEYECFWKGLQ